MYITTGMESMIHPVKLTFEIIHIAEGPLLVGAIKGKGGQNAVAIENWYGGKVKISCFGKDCVAIAIPLLPFLRKLPLGSEPLWRPPSEFHSLRGVLLPVRHDAFTVRHDAAMMPP